MKQLTATMLAGVFFFSSMTGMGQWSFTASLHAKSFDLEDEDDLDDENKDEDFEDTPKEEKKKESSSSGSGDLDDIDALMSDEPVKKKPAESSSDDLDDEAPADGRSLAFFYFFADSTAEKKAADIVRFTGQYLKERSEYRFFETEARLFNDFSYRKLTDDIPKIEKLLEEGKTLYEDAEVEEALSKFNGALNLLEKRIDSLHDYTLLANALFDVGCSWKMLEEDDKAKEHFLKLLAISPDHEAGDWIDDDTRDFFDSVKSKVMVQPLGELSMTSEPAGATVYLDGKIAGMTPLKLDGVTVGKHYWRIHKNGYRDIGGIVNVREESAAKVKETLAAAAGAEAIAEWERMAPSAFGSAAMMKKAVDIGKAAKLDRMFLLQTRVETSEEEGTMVKVELRMVNPAKAAFKEERASFSLPSSGDMSRSEDLRTALENLFSDDYGYNPVSSIVSGSLGEDDDGGEDDGGVATKWWFWTIIGTVVAGGVTTGCLLAIPGSPVYLGKKSDGGATMTIHFGQ
ncbi:MAG TPA: PEGA domain-containing protein [bacterium]|nr:PEGA domain-containing protein [bacterium]